MSVNKIDVDIPAGVQIATAPGSPTTLGWSMAVGSVVLDKTNGALYISTGAASWAALGSGGGLTQSQTDSWYLKLSGGALSGLLTFNGASSTSNAFAGYGPGDANARFYARVDGYMAWGPGTAATDVTLSRTSASWLQTSGTLEALGVLVASGTGGFTIGSRSGAARVMYAQSAATAFSMLTAANGYASLYLANVYTAGGFGLVSTDTGGATFRFAPGASAFIDFLSGDATNGAVRLFFNGALRGHFFANANGVGILNDQTVQWSLRCNYGSGLGGTLYGAWLFDTYLTLQSGGTSYGYVGPASSAGALINTSALGDLCFRSQGLSLLFSTDSGASAFVKMGGGTFTQQGVDVAKIQWQTGTLSTTQAAPASGRGTIMFQVI